MSLELSIIIVNWNTKEVTLDCLRSIYGQTKNISFEIILVDNASFDGSVAAIKKEFPGVVIIENQQNVGFARANNRGMNKAKGRYFLLLNSDTVVLDKALEDLVDFMDKNPKVGAVSPRLVGRDGKIQQSAAKFPSLWHYFNEYLFKKMTAWYPEEKLSDLEVDTIAGACLMVRKEVIDQIGSLCEDYFMYSEDVDLCYRIKKSGWIVMSLAQLRVIHLGGESSEKVKKEMDRKLLESRIIFFKEVHPHWEVFALKLIMAIGGLRNALRDFVNYE
ncbi:MAG: glycosyltransferase family 2 protein [Patescibacteria group bacterium]|nr:glycosyltransferase family 2 protein [Patescibacteria group bacterium]